MQIETKHGLVTLSRQSGEQLLRHFSASWSMPVVALSPGSSGEASYGVVFQVGDEEAWCFLHLLPPERGPGVEVTLLLLEKAMNEAMCKLSEWRPPGVLLPCACLLEDDLGGMTPGMALFTSDVLGRDRVEQERSELADAFVDLLSTTLSGAQLPTFVARRRVPRLAAGAIKFDTALVDGTPLCFRVEPVGELDEEEQRELISVWAMAGIKHVAWAPAIPIYLSTEEAAALKRGDGGQQGETAGETDETLGDADETRAETDETPGETDETPGEADDSREVEGTPATPASVSMPLPTIAPVPGGAQDAKPAPAADSSAWGPTVMDIGASLRNSADRDTLVRLRGASIGRDDDADEAAKSAVERPGTRTEVGVKLLRQTDPAIGDNGAATSSPALEAPSIAADWAAATDHAPSGDGTFTADARITAGYAAIGLATSAPVETRAPVETPAPTDPAEPVERSAREVAAASIADRADGPALLAGLSASPWSSLHEFAGDRAHTAMLCQALRRRSATERSTTERSTTERSTTEQWPSWLPEAESVRRVGEDLHLVRAHRVVAVLAVRLVRDIDRIQLANARQTASDAPGWLFTIEHLDASLTPPGWSNRTIDELATLCGEAQQDAVSSQHADVLRGLAAARLAFVHDTLADGSPWAETLANSAFGPCLLQSLHRDVISHVLGGIRQHGWPKLDHVAVARGAKPSSRVFDAAVRCNNDEVLSEVAIIDPDSPHLFGVRAVGGRLLIFAEAFDPRATGLDAKLAWGRRNEFLRDLCALLQIDPKFIEGQATDASRVVEIDTYDLLRADSRTALTQTLVETSWVLWQRTHNGRFARR